MAIIRKSMQDIKTYAGKAGAASKSKSAGAVFLKIAMLELERERQARDRITTATRAQRIEARMQEIEAEVGALHDAAGGATGKRRAAAPDSPEAAPRRRVFRF